MRALAIIATVVAMASGPSVAQLASGVSGSSGVRESGRDETWYTVRELGRCLVASKAVAADALVRTAPGSPAENAAVKTLIGRNSICLRGANQLRASRFMIRGSIADALYKARFAKTGRLPVDAAGTAGQAPPRSLSEVSACFAARHGSQVHTLVTTTPIGSALEAREVARIIPGLRDCFIAADKFTTDATSFRMMWVEALYLADTAGGV